MKSLLYVAVAIVLILVGLVMFPLPIPLGAPMVALGIVILITHSRNSARFMTMLRVSYPRFNGVIKMLENKAPRTISRSLRRTRPEILRYFGRSRNAVPPV